MRLFSLARDAMAFFAFAAALCLVPFAALSQSTFPPVPKVLVAANPITNRIYVVDELANAIRVIDEAAGTTRTIAVDTRPQFVAVNPATNRIYTSNNNSGSITVIDGATETTTTLPVGSLGPMVVDASRNLIYILRLSSAQFDEVTYFFGETNNQYSISARMYAPSGVALNPVTQEILVPGYATGRAAILDARYRSEGYPCGHEPEPYPCPTLGTGVKPFTAAIDPTLDKAVGISENASSALWIANVAGRSIANFSLDASGAMYQPRGLGVNPVTHKAYAIFDGRLVVVDIAAGTFDVIADSRFAGTSAVGVGVNSATNKVYVVADDGKLTIIDGTSNLRTPVTISAGLHSIGVNPVTNKLYLAGNGGTYEVLNGVAGSATVPLTTTITPLPGNQSGRDVTITMNASSTFGPNALPIRAVYWQLDGTGAAWTAATGSGNGPYTVALTGLNAGTHTLRAFAVDGQDAPLNTGPQSMPLVGAIASYTFTVAGATPTVSLAASAATSFSGQPVTFTASVSGSAGTPTGTVQFRDGASAIAGCTAVSLASGSAQCTTSSLSAGAHSVTAVYSGNATYEGATSSAVTHTVQAPIAPSVAVSSSLNPATTGQAVTFTASVTGSRGTATGTVQFRDGATTIAGCGAVTLASGSAQCTTSSLSAGAHSITAVYASTSPAYSGATSPAFTQNVTAPPVAPTVTLASSPNPSTGGQNVTFTANVSGSRGAATGTVEFRDGGAAISGCASVALASGSATCTTAALATGTRSITARYGGDANYTAATSATLTQTVNPAPQAQLTLSANAVAFGGQSMGTTSPARTVTASNTGNVTLTVNGITVSSPQYGVAHNCGTLAPGATCTISVVFKPAASDGTLNTQVAVNGTLSVASTAPGSPANAALSGTAEKSLATHFYQSILRRAPDAGGRQYWEGEAARVAGLGANVNEAWYALAMTFYQGPEYEGLQRSNDAYLTDLYRTFFNRDPDSAGLAYWADLLARGMPRDVVLAEFMLGPEFRAFSAGIFGDVSVRAEVDVAGDFYRGLLARLPDSAGFQYWLGRFRAAQCQGSNAVVAEAEAISSGFLSSAEYAQRARSNEEFVADLYNAFLRRGGDLDGVRFWIGELERGAITRDQVRRTFTQTPEFQARVQRVISAGCQQ